MGLLDSIDLDELAKKVLAQYETKSDSSPLTTGLLAAGLGILANNRGNPMEAIGQGGLLGLQGYSQAKQAQQKDPAALISTLAGLQGLQQTAMKNRWLQEFNTPTAQAPQYGMQDRSMGIAPQLSPAQSGAMPMNRIVGGMVAGMPGADKLYEAMTKQPQKYGPGDIPAKLNAFTGEWEQGSQIPNIDKGMRATPSGGAEPIPGYADSAAKIAGATTEAQERSKAGLDMIRVPDGNNGWKWMPRLQAAQATVGEGEPPADVKAAMSELTKRGILARWTAGNGLQVGDAAKTSAGFGVERSPEAIKAAEIAATNPFEVQKSAQTGANTDFVTNEYRPTMTQAQAARKSLAGLDVLDNQKINTGWGKTGQVYAARVLEGIGFAPDKAKELANDATVFNQVLSTETFRKLQEAKGVQTEGDAERARQQYSQLTNPNQANQFIRDLARAQHNQEVAKGKFYGERYSDAVKSGNPYALETAWQAQQRSIFDDPAMKKWSIVEAPTKEKSGEMTKQGAPAPGAVVSGYRFRGGNPNDRNAWERM